MVRRRGRKSSLRGAVLVAAAAVAAGAAGAAGKADFAGADPSTETYQTSWDSSPFNLESVTDNNLGLMAKSCSEQYCHAGINELDLWISFEEVCTLSSQPYLATVLGEEEQQAAGGVGVGGTLSSGDWHPVAAGVLCGFVGAASMVAGFKLGADFHSYHKGILH